MTRNHGWVTVLLTLLLTACASQSRYDVNLSMSELSDAIVEADGEAIEVDADVHFSPTVSSGVWFTGQGTSDLDGFANNRVVFSYRQTLDLDYRAYRAGPGFEMSFTGSDDVYQFRGALFIQSAAFLDGVVEGYNSPALVGVDLGVQAVYDQDPIEFFAGVQGTAAALVYEFDSPVKVGYETYDGDNLSIFGLGIPLGMHMMLGPFSLEAVYTPTVYLHASETTIGATNDLITWSTHAPVSFGVGLNW